MNEVIKKRHHYVWKHYLKPWTVNEQIGCLREGKRFLTSLENIAQKRYFYESPPLNELELKFVDSFFGKVHPTAKKSLNGLFEVYLKSAYTNDYNRKCGLEDFYSVVEGNFIPILDKIYNTDLSFLDDLKERNHFSFFIGIQYMRTLKMRDNFVNSQINVPHGINKDNIAKIISLFFADIIGNWVFQVGRLNLLHNKSDLDFITGDQPVFNKKGYKKVNGNVKEFDLYFPITPSLAIQISDYVEGENFLDKKSVIQYNKMIKLNSKEQIYSKTLSDFDIYLDI